jgi:5-methylcytosine-specific restriction endonuclease McrA
MIDVNDYFAWLQLTPKQRFEQTPKRNLSTRADEQEFLLSWFKNSNYERKIEVAYSYGLIALDDNQRFIVRNSYARDYEDMRLQILESIYWRDGENCAYCFRDIRLGNGEIDHVIPRSAWPKEWLWLADDSSNLVAACKACNQSKSNFYERFKGENRMLHVAFECKSPILYDYECCKSRATDSGQSLCQHCDHNIEICCRVHQEIRMPACEIKILQKWFGHEKF